MKTHPIQLNDVMYNPATQSFEALVTVHDGDVARKYACAINAPISTSFEDAVTGLKRQAERRHLHRGGMLSELQRAAPTQRSGRPRFDPRAWLENVIKSNDRHAA